MKRSFCSASRVAAGAALVLCASSAPSLRTWGWWRNQAGQLWAAPSPGHLGSPIGTAILGTFTSAILPIEPSSINSATLLLNADGRIVVCGGNSFGQFGTGVPSNPLNGIPTLVSSHLNTAAPLENVIQLSKPGVSNAEHTVALIATGQAVAWGRMHHQMDHAPNVFPAGSGIGGGIGDSQNYLTSVAAIEATQLIRVQHNPPGPPSPPVDGIKQVATTAGGTYLLLADGRVLSFGFPGVSGGLGRPTPTAPQTDLDPLPVQFDVPAGQSPPLIKQICAGWSFAACLDAEGNVWMMGDNVSSQLGRPAGGSTATPGQVGGGSGGAPFRAWRVPNVSRVKLIASAHMTMLALRSNGTVYMWGDDIRTSVAANHVPLLPIILPGVSNVTGMWAGHYAAYLLLATGRVVVFGRNSTDDLGIPNLPWPQAFYPPLVTNPGGLVNLSPPNPNEGVIGGGGQMLIQATGIPVAWGSNDNSQLGLFVSIPAKPPFASFFSDPPKSDPTSVKMPSGLPRTDLHFQSYSTSYYHSLAIDAWGKVWAAGDESKMPGVADSAFLGNGPGATKRGQFVQTMLNATLPLDNAIQVEASLGNSYALRSNGTLWGWGRAPSQPATPVTPVQKPFNYSGSHAGRIIQVTSAGRNTYILRDDGIVVARGSDGFGQLGNGPGVAHSWNAWSPVKGLENIIEIAAATGLKPDHVHLVALRADGKVLTVGANMQGQLGHHGSNSQHGVATAKLGNTQTPIDMVKSIAAGEGAFTLALKADGRVVSWGSNSESECAQGSSAAWCYPATIPSLSGTVLVKSFAAGFQCASVLTSDGRVLAWGSNNSYQVGSGYPDPQPTPKPIDLSQFLLQNQDPLFYRLFMGSDANCSVAISAD